MGHAKGLAPPRHSTTEFIPHCNLIKNRPSTEESQMAWIDRVLIRFFDWVRNSLESSHGGGKQSGPSINHYCPGSDIQRGQNSASIKMLNRYAKETKRAKGGRLRM